MFWGKRFEFTSAAGRHELADRVKAAIDSEWNVFGGKRFLGRVNADEFKLCIRQGKAPFQTVLYGTFTEINGTTIISGRSGMLRSVRVFYGFLVFLMFLNLGPIWIGYKASSLTLSQKWAESELFFIATAFVAGMILLGRMFARSE